MPEKDERERFRSLPQPVRPEDTVETVDTTARPAHDSEAEERARMLRLAGGI